MRLPPGTSVWTKTKHLYKENPASVSLAFAAILAGIGGIVYANYLYQSYIIAAFHTFPEEVAKPLRKALYYTNVDLSPKEALRYYKQAINACMETNMDPFSDEALGIYIQLAAFFEKISQFKKSIEVLEQIRSDSLKWLDKMGGQEGNEGKKTRILGKTVQLSVKLADLYSGQHVLELGMAEAHLLYAVETALGEQQRREKEGVRPEEGEWMGAAAIGATLEELGHHYEARNQFHLAGPLFLRALNLSEPGTCHAAVLSRRFE